MSKLLVLTFLSINSLFALEFYSYAEALKLQKKNHKVIMIDVVRDDCHYCQDMNRDVLQDSKMSQHLSNKFIPVKINLDHDKLPLGIKVNFTPTFFFINTQGEIIKKIPGSWNIKDFTDLTKNIK